MTADRVIGQMPDGVLSLIPRPGGRFIRGIESEAGRLQRRRDPVAQLFELGSRHRTGRIARMAAGSGNVIVRNGWQELPGFV
jgi:hypothetical protein